jgi:hypothetical protein
MREDSSQEYVPRVIQTVSGHVLKPIRGQNGVLVAYEGQPKFVPLEWEISEVH